MQFQEQSVPYKFWQNWWTSMGYFVAYQPIGFHGLQSTRQAFHGIW